MSVETRPPAPPSARPPARRPRSSGGLFRAFWRWHFYASFVVIPVLLVLSVTGLIYLFRFQLEPVLHPSLMQVEKPAGTDVAQPYAGQLRAVEEAYPGAVPVSLAEPREEGRPTVVSVTMPDGEGRDVHVDPWTADVLGSLDPDTTLSGYAIRLHADLMSGTPGDLVMELGTCWAIVMAITGYYLFVRGRKARKRRAAAGKRGARLRARHGVLGSVVGVGLLAMVVTGLPWTGVWGSTVQGLATTTGTSMWSLDHGAESAPLSTLDESLPHSHAELPWALQESEVPRSQGGSDAHEDGTVAVANVDTAIEVADGEGLRHPMTVALPTSEDGTFSVIGYAFDAPSDERTVHVDRYDGEVRSAYGYDDYPLLAQVVSQGIGVHEGRGLGGWTMALAAAFCLGVITLCVTGPLMWWRRRPSGRRVGAPRGRLPVRGSRTLAAGLVALAVFLPVFGVSLVVVLLLDRFVVRRVPALGDFFGSAPA